MNRKLLWGLLVSIPVGVWITLMSRLFLTPFSRIGVDVALRGVPLAWFVQVFPTRSNMLWGNFTLDVIFWILIAFAAILLLLNTGGIREIARGRLTNPKVLGRSST